MIANPTPTGWQIIYQRAHALLAGQIALHWRVDQRPLGGTRWMETLAAIVQHDDGSREWDGDGLLTPAGTPLDFKLGEPSLNKPRTLMAASREQGQYIALLHSMHLCTLYKDFDDAEIKAFIAEQQNQQRAWRKALNIPKAEADAAYRLLYLCDSFSLILCQLQLPTDGRAVEIGEGIDGTTYRAHRKPDTGGSDPRAGDRVVMTVEPWAFEDESVTLSIEATEIEGGSFDSDAAFRGAIRSGGITPLTWHLEKFTNR